MSVSPPIVAAPINALFLGIFIGFSFINLAIDASGDGELQRAFYNAKTAGPLWFVSFNAIMAFMGLVSNVSNVVFVFTRNSPRARKLADIVQAVLFVVLASVVITLATSFTPNVDWAAHAGGTVQGALWGIVLLSNELDHKRNQVSE